MVCMHSYTYIHTYTHTYIHTVSMYVFISACMYAYVYASFYMYTQTYILCTYIHILIIDVLKKLGEESFSQIASSLVEVFIINLLRYMLSAIAQGFGNQKNCKFHRVDQCFYSYA